MVTIGQSPGGPQGNYLTTEVPSFISHLPDELNGYLVFDVTQASGVVTWGCVVKELYLSPGDTIVSDSIYFTYQTTKDYLLLPEKVTSDVIGSFLLDIRGYDENDDVVKHVYNLVPFAESPFPTEILFGAYGVTSEFVKKTTCNGSTSTGYLFPYAWDIFAWEMMNDFSTSLGTFLQVKTGTYTDANGQSANFWAYYNVSNYLSWCANSALCPPDQVNIKQIPNSNFTDPAGHPITGTNVMAVRKKANSWGQNGGLRAPAWDPVNNTGYFANQGSYYSGWNQTTFLTQMNNDGDFHPSTNIYITDPIVCNPSLSGIPSSGYYNGHGWLMNWLKDRQEKLLEFPDIPADTSAGPSGNPGYPSLPAIENVWSIMAELEIQSEININGNSDSDDNIGPFGIGSNFEDFVTAFYVTDFFDPETSVEFIPSEWLSTSGEFEGPSGELPAGFYILTAAFSNGEIFTRAVEAEQGIDYSYELSDMVEISVFPSPLDRNEDISFEFLSSISTDIDYELLDHNGTTCLTHTFSVAKGDNADDLSIPPGFGAGLVFHRFLFSDNSVKVVESIID
jgi:hypothetical protein